MHEMVESFTRGFCRNRWGYWGGVPVNTIPEPEVYHAQKSHGMQIPSFGNTCVWQPLTFGNIVVEATRTDHLNSQQSADMRKIACCARNDTGELLGVTSGKVQQGAAYHRSSERLRQRRHPPHRALNRGASEPVLACLCRSPHKHGGFSIPEAPRLAPLLLIRRRPPAFQPTDNEIIIDKYIYTCVTADFLEDLRTKGIEEVAICGIDIDVCVSACAIGLFENGIGPILLSEACASHAGPEYHQAALRRLPLLIGRNHIL